MNLKTQIMLLFMLIACSAIASATCNTVKGDFYCTGNIDVRVVASTGVLAEDYFLNSNGVACTISDNKISDGYQKWSCPCGGNNNLSICGDNQKSAYDFNIRYYSSPNIPRDFTIAGMGVKSKILSAEEVKRQQQASADVTSVFTTALIILVFVSVIGLFFISWWVWKYVKNKKEDDDDGW